MLGVGFCIIVGLFTQTLSMAAKCYNLFLILHVTWSLIEILNFEGDCFDQCYFFFLNLTINRWVI